MLELEFFKTGFEFVLQRQEEEVGRLIRRQQQELQLEVERYAYAAEYVDVRGNSTMQIIMYLPYSMLSRITRHFQQLHSKNAGILLGDSSLTDPPNGSSRLSNSQHQDIFGSDCERGGGLIQRQQRAVTAAETCKLRRQ